MRIAVPENASMQSAPAGVRLAIAFFGRRNAGKSSLVNALAGQEVSLVSDTPGATADPVRKSMELLPIGPVSVIDTAGLDDVGELGAQKIRRAQKILGEIDLAVLVCDASRPDRSLEIEWLKQFENLRGRLIIVENKSDLAAAPAGWAPADIPLVKVSSVSGLGLDDLRGSLTKKLAGAPGAEPSLVAGLFPPKSFFLLVTPQDPQAPKGRLILPQVRVMRDILDHHGLFAAADLAGLPSLIGALKRQPDLVIVDSQIFRQAADLIPADWALTSFSVIMARAAGDLGVLADGARRLTKLAPGDRVLIAEACTHHAMKNDIARETIPAILSRAAGGPVQVDVMAGHDFPENVTDYKLVILCGGCMIGRREYMSRLSAAALAGVAASNFGLVMAEASGILERALAPFIFCRPLNTL